ncbi:uncharacterized protein TRAVEDRAFT_136429 [Trametes versicolor FP-101664 SS1]|uniref:Uncharacterized protein n=1 Tax=Trametes versicolor (strain FP-101664) TaxID=717944 RepID=R7S8M4_TRAVS|nr:uncharacterized protein TRAVEDRAFT_136429 [Trametes versicolor FP-101664 SS1]EIW52007.1 hypothetical protein TRAVEDRAFT_136429 [Trametes versicolor FP-101664 SS1]
MFSKSIISSVVLCLGLALQASAHAIITPALGVSGTAVRADVQRPSAATECGAINIPQNIDSSTPAVANDAGIFNVTITDFNGGVDGSRQIATVLVDPTGTGNFAKAQPATMLLNGDLAPTVVGSQPLTVQLPAGVECAGGASANKCLVSFTTAGNFGNCVVVEQSA